MEELGIVVTYAVDFDDVQRARKSTLEMCEDAECKDVVSADTAAMMRKAVDFMYELIKTSAKNTVVVENWGGEEAEEILNVIKERLKGRGNNYDKA